MERKFQGNRMVIVSCIYIFLVQGIVASWTIPYASYFPDYFGQPITVLSIGVTICTVMGFLTGLIAGPVIHKLQAKGVMIIGALLTVVWPVLWAVSTSIAVYFAGWVLIDVVNGICIQGPVQHLIVQWYVSKRASMIALAIGCSTLGQAAGQFVMGLLLPRLGVSRTFLILGIACGVIALLMALSVINKPADIGQMAPGSETSGPETQKEDDGSRADKASAKGLYKNPVFYIFLFAFFFLGQSCPNVGNFGTAYIPSESLGIDFSAASTLVSLMSLLTGAITMFLIGRIVDRLGAKACIFITGLFAIAANLFAAVYTGSQSWPVLIAIMICYGFGFCTFNLCNMVTPVFLDSAYVTEANTKAIAFVMLSSALINPISASIITGAGYQGMFLFSAGWAALGVILAIVMFAAQKKTGR